jgi:hypothetical protein
MPRLRTLVLYINESGRKYVRRAKESIKRMTFAAQATDGQPNFRLNRNVRTIQRLDYIYQLRGLQSLRIFDFEIWITKSVLVPIRDWTFLVDLETATTRPKSGDALKLEQLCKLDAVTGFPTADEQMFNAISAFYDESGPCPEADRAKRGFVEAVLKKDIDCQVPVPELYQPKADSIAGRDSKVEILLTNSMAVPGVRKLEPQILVNEDDSSDRNDEDPSHGTDLLEISPTTLKGPTMNLTLPDFPSDSTLPKDRPYTVSPSSATTPEPTPDTDTPLAQQERCFTSPTSNLFCGPAIPSPANHNPEESVSQAFSNIFSFQNETTPRRRHTSPNLWIQSRSSTTPSDVGQRGNPEDSILHAVDRALEGVNLGVPDRNFSPSCLTNTYSPYRSRPLYQSSTGDTEVLPSIPETALWDESPEIASRMSSVTPTRYTPSYVQNILADRNIAFDEEQSRDSSFTDEVSPSKRQGDAQAEDSPPKRRRMQSSPPLKATKLPA